MQVNDENLKYLHDVVMTRIDGVTVWFTRIDKTCRWEVYRCQKGSSIASSVNIGEVELNDLSADVSALKTAYLALFRTDYFCDRQRN